MTEFGKIVFATVLSVLAHVSLFTALALMPVAAPTRVRPEAEENPLEVSFEAAPSEVVEEAALAQTDAIRTQIDPANLKKAEKAPEHPKEIAAHDSQATPPKAVPSSPPVAPTPPPDFIATLESVAPPAAVPQPEADEVGIDALGNYGKAVGNAIGAPWELYRRVRKDLGVGEVRIQCIIDAQGRVAEVKVLSNTAPPANAQIALRAVKEAHIPPIPPERLAQVPGGRIKIVYTFTIY